MIKHITGTQSWSAGKSTPGSSQAKKFSACLILPGSCLSVSLHSNLTDSVPGSVSTSDSSSLPNLISAFTCLSLFISLCSSLCVFLCVFLFVSVSLFFLLLLSLPLALYIERAAVCLCVCVSVSVCVHVCAFSPLSLFLRLSLSHTCSCIHKQPMALLFSSSLLTPINCYMFPTQTQWKTMFPCREISFLTRKQSPNTNTGSSLSSASRIFHEDPNI